MRLVKKYILRPIFCFQSAFSGLNSTQLSGLYRQNQLNQWSTPRALPGVLGMDIFGAINQAIVDSCFRRSIEIEGKINNQIQAAANSSQSCGNVYWQVNYKIGSPTGCIATYNITIANDESAWHEIATPVQHGWDWRMVRGRL